MDFQNTNAIVRGLYRAIEARNFGLAAGYLSPNVVVTNAGSGDRHEGVEGFLRYVRGWSAAIPDLQIRVIRIVAQPDTAAVEYELSGRQTGPLLTPGGHIPPTGMQLQLRVCDLLTFGAGRVEAVTSYFDATSLLRQLGLLASTPLHSPDRRATLDLYAHAMEAHAPQRNRAIVQRLMNDVLNRQNPTAAADTCSRQHVWHGGSLGETRGLAGYEQLLDDLFGAFPDLTVEIVDTIAEADQVVARFTLSGTHRGEFQGIQPTRKRISADGTSTFRLEEGRIVEEWWQMDLLSLLQQMDAVPPAVRLGR